MPNVKRLEAGRALRLMPWQRLVFTNLFGFVEPGTNTRRFRQGVVFVPRSNGKTTFAAPLALYMTFMTGEGGAEGYAAAVTRDQARIMFDAALNMVRRSPESRRFAKRRLLAGLQYVPRVRRVGARDLSGRCRGVLLFRPEWPATLVYPLQ